MNVFNHYLEIIKKLHSSIEKWISLKDCLEYFKEKCDDYEKSTLENPNKDHWKHSRVRILLEVHERLELTDFLKKEIGEEVGGLIIRRNMYPSLIRYLRLTCFDQLGQPENRISFDQWLTSKKKKDERERIILKINQEDKVKFTEELFLEYQNIYGVKNSFYRFLREIITDEARENLLNKIRITNQFKSIGTLTGDYIAGDSNDEEKEEYLYSIRNNYTHNTFFTKSDIVDITSNKFKNDWRIRDIIFKNKEKKGIFTYFDFDEYLKEVILIGISEIIKRK